MATTVRGLDPALITRDCPLCGSDRDRPEPRYSVAPWRLVRCARCAFVYLKDAPSYERLADELAWEKTPMDERVRRRRNHPVVVWIERTTGWRLSSILDKRTRLYRRLFKSGRVLDIGCLRGRGIPEPLIPYGVEISRAMAREADAYMKSRGGRVVCAPALEGIAEFPDRYFAGVILSSVLEHEINPKPLLCQVARVLADGGRAYVRVPNFGGANRRVMGAKWSGFHHPYHVNYFTTDALRRMAADCGLRLRRLNPLSPFDDNIKAVLTRA
jgi:SAM-dependent methyltransferase